MFEKIKDWAVKEWKATLKQFGIKPKEAPTMMTEQSQIYEINLVPEVKRQMIKAMKFRNIMLFVCIVLVAVAGATVVIMGGIWEGQNIAMSNQDKKLKTMSDKLNNYDSLSEFLTIQTQLNNLDEINTNKKVLSRVFPILSTILPEGPDTIEISELSVDLSTNTIRFDAQADAKVSPYIDYRVLESFKKGVSLMKYDYGRYVDADENEIPTRCLVETDADGNLLTEEETVATTKTSYTYAYWLKGKKGCDPARDDTEEEDEDETTASSARGASNSVNQMLTEFAVTRTNTDLEEGAEENAEAATEETNATQAAFNKKLDELDDYGKSLAYQQLNSGVLMDDVEVVKIYRSPRFSDWYKAGYMDESGEIVGVPHFNSECITYTGASTGSGMKWTSNNDCMLAADDVVIRDSSNGRDSSGNLVLRFNATIPLSETVFKFTNKHILAISPTGQNVTDSYRQIEGMFAERAADCSDSDVICTTTSTDSGGDS